MKFKFFPHNIHYISQIILLNDILRKIAMLKCAEFVTDGGSDNGPSDRSYQTAKDRCLPLGTSYCFNNGVCSISETDELICNCPKEYFGDRCEFSKSIFIMLFTVKT